MSDIVASEAMTSGMFIGAAVDRIEFESPDYEVCQVVSADVAQDIVQLGRPGKCRFCLTEDPAAFRHVSHTFPEGLGNKWVVSLDECDRCNEQFARYDDALVKSVGAVLTLGGTKGKKNKVRQTGRTNGTHIAHSRSHDDRRHLSFKGIVDNLESHVHADPVTGILQINMPVSTHDRFVPLLAYKALVKMGLALMPADQLHHFERLRKWLVSPEDNIPLPFMNVGLSFGSLGNALPHALGALLKGKKGSSGVAYMVFVISIGSVCFQIDLKGNTADGRWLPMGEVHLGINWKNVLTGGSTNPNDHITLQYGRPHQLDWSSLVPTVPPVESLTIKINPVTEDVWVTAHFRALARKIPFPNGFPNSSELFASEVNIMPRAINRAPPPRGKLKS